MVGLQVQMAAEAEVADFVAANPVPEYEFGSSMDEFERFNAELLEYYERVPWDATVEQWGCVVTEPAEWSARTTSTGEPTVVVEEGHRCADLDIASHHAGILLPKSQVLAELAEGSERSLPGILGCGSGSEVSMCLSQPAASRIRASATFTGSGNAAAYIRLGQSASLNSSVWGNQIATGGDGVWVRNTSRSVEATVRQNANWTNSWMRDRGSGAVSQGTYCQLI
jgi:hypothetical protein